MESELVAMRRSYSKLGRSHKHLGYAIGYPAKLDRLEACLRTNGALTAAIAAFAREQYPSLKHGQLEAGAEMDGDVARVREALRHFVRDWSAEGQSERERIFTPILKVLAQVLPESRGEMKVLVPGSGLGRLAWEISELGALHETVTTCWRSPCAKTVLCHDVVHNIVAQNIFSPVATSRIALAWTLTAFHRLPNHRDRTLPIHDPRPSISPLAHIDLHVQSTHTSPLRFLVLTSAHHRK